MLSGIFEKYQARPFDGAVELFLSKSIHGAYRGNTNAAWSGLSTKQVTVHLTNAKTDWSFLQEPEVGSLAARISDILRKH